MIGIFRLCLQNLTRLLVVVRPSRKRSIYLLAFVLSLSLLVLYIVFSVNRAKADTPTPTPTPHDIIIPNPPPNYDDTLECLISGGSVGYDATYARILQGDYTYGDTIVSFTNNAIPYNAWVEFSYLSIPYVPDDNWRIDIVLYSENGYFTPEYITYKGVRYNDTIIELDTGAVFGVAYSSSTNSCKFSFVGDGPLGDPDTTGFQNMINDGTLSISGSWHMSSPGVVYMDYYGYIYDDWNDIPSVFPDAPSFPDVATDEPVAGDEPSYNSLFGALNNTLQWIGNVIITAVENIFGDPTDLIAELENFQTAFDPVTEIFTNDDHNGLLDMSQEIVDLIESTPTEAVLTFGGLKMSANVVGYNDMPLWLSITGYHTSGEAHQSIAFGVGEYIIPPFRIDFGAMFSDMGLEGWLYLIIRIIALGCVSTYMWSLFKRSLAIVTGDTVRGIMIADRTDALQLR